MIVFTDDSGDLLIWILLGGVSVGFVRFAKRQSNGSAHFAFLRAVGFIDQERDPQFLQFRIVFNLFQHPGKLLLSGDNYRLVFIEEAHKVGGLSRYTDNIFEVREVLDIVLDVLVE